MCFATGCLPRTSAWNILIMPAATLFQEAAAEMSFNIGAHSPNAAPFLASFMNLIHPVSLEKINDMAIEWAYQGKGSPLQTR